MFNIYQREFYNGIRNDKIDFCEGLPEIGYVTQFWTYLWVNYTENKSDGMW